MEWRNLPPPCCRPIAMGDLSAQSNNRFQTPLSPYRHAAPLEMTCRRPALQSWGKETNDIDTIRPTVISTATEQSGVEWRNLQPQWYQCLPLPLSFRPERSKAEWSGEISGPNGTSASPSHCHFDRNGAKRSGVEKSPAPMAQAPLWREISRLRASMEFKYLDLPADTQPRSR